jgi:hypothetical protein
MGQVTLHFVKADVRSHEASPANEPCTAGTPCNVVRDDCVSARLHFELDIEGEPRRVQFVEVKQAGTGVVELHVPADQPVPISHGQLKQVSENYFRRALSVIEHTSGVQLDVEADASDVQSIEMGKWYRVDLSG